MVGDPFLAFHEDHERIRPGLRSLEAALDAAMNRDRAGAAELATFRESLELLRTEGFDHFRREERALLPPLEARIGRFGTLVSVIAYDHEEIRREVGKFEDALTRLEAKAGTAHGPELRELNRHGIFIVQDLSLHMAKEDSSLAELARKALGEEGMREVSRRLEDGG